MTLFDKLNDKAKKEKDIDAVESIYLKYRNLMFIVADSIIQNSALAEEIVQESIIKVIRNLDKIKNTDISSPKMKNLMVTIVKNACFDELRKRKNVNLLNIDDVEYDISDETVDIENLIISKDTVAAIAEIIDELDYKYSTVLRLRYFSDLPYEEISNLLDITPEAARKRSQRGKKLLIECLQKGGVIDGR